MRLAGLLEVPENSPDVPDIDRPCRKQAEIVVTVWRDDHVRLGNLEGHVNKESPVQTGSDLSGGFEHFPCKFQ